MIAVLKAYTSLPDPSLDARYAALTPDQFTILDAIRYLIVNIQQKLQASRKKIPDSADPTLGYLPTDKVFEHGFDPLENGFVAEAKTPFEVFDRSSLLTRSFLSKRPTTRKRAWLSEL
jgi:hypothetical protein